MGLQYLSDKLVHRLWKGWALIEICYWHCALHLLFGDNMINTDGLGFKKGPVPTSPYTGFDEMPAHFGPLSADEPFLEGLSKNDALRSIRSKIRREIKQVAPAKPARRLPHNPLHKETGPWLCLGIGPGEQNHAGRWYQHVCFFNHTSQ